MKKLVITLIGTALLMGCQSTTKYVQSNDKNIATFGLSYRDFDDSANKALEDIISSPLLVHPQGARYVMAVSNIINDTTQRIDTDQLTKKIRVGLLQSGKFITTTAIGLKGAEDKMTEAVRALKDSDMVKKSTVAGSNAVIAPDFSLSGKIIQRTNRIDNSTQLVDYYFQLTLTQLETGLAFWEGEYPISKTGSNKSVTW